MKNPHERTDDYAIRGGYEAKNFTFACIKEGKTAVLERVVTADSYKKEMKKLFNDDIKATGVSMTFFWAQACMIAIQAGVNERTADNVYRDRYLMIGSVDTVDKFLDINAQILVEYAQAVREVKEEHDYSPRVKSCLNYIAEHLCDDISVDSLAAELGFNSNYLSQQFKKETGKTIMSYIQTEKMKAARIMLGSSEMPISEVMAYLGYTSQSHFSETFKKYAGVTPGKYRKSCGAVQNDPVLIYRELLKSGPEDNWFTDAIDYGLERGNEEKAYVFSCIRRGKTDALKEQLEDIGYMARMHLLFGGSLLHATETMLCLWPQAAMAALESGVEPQLIGDELKKYTGYLYSCTKTEEIINLNVNYLCELSLLVEQI